MPHLRLGGAILLITHCHICDQRSFFQTLLVATSMQRRGLMMNLYKIIFSYRTVWGHCEYLHFQLPPNAQGNGGLTARCLIRAGL
jgi:hypothetical protein